MICIKYFKYSKFNFFFIIMFYYYFVNSVSIKWFNDWYNVYYFMISKISMVITILIWYNWYEWYYEWYELYDDMFWFFINKYEYQHCKWMRYCLYCQFLNEWDTVTTNTIDKASIAMI